jgi:hypothetical protein
MKLQLIKQIVGIRDRGLPTEHRHIYADIGDRVHVIFDNTIDASTLDLFITNGHYICEKNDQHFVVFPSQYDLSFEDRGDIRNMIPITLIENDLLHSEPTELIEDILE